MSENIEEVKCEEISTEETKPEGKEEKAQGPQSIAKWQEREPDTPGEALQDSGKHRFVLLAAGAVLVIAVVSLTVCLYGVSKKLKSVQALSDGLRADLEVARAEMERLSQNREGDGTMSAADVTPEPKATPSPLPTPPPEVYTVCIDAGHGAHDMGAVLALEDGTYRLEKNDNLWMAQLVQRELEAYGVKVIMTREDDMFLELYDRTFAANSLDVDALISFHRNAYYQSGEMSSKVGGVEIWVHSSLPEDATRLAKNMLQAIQEVGGMENRGLKYGSKTDAKEDFAINRRAMMPSMIVELGFISNPEDNAAYDANGEAYAKAMAEEIYAWLGTLR